MFVGFSSHLSVTVAHLPLLAVLLQHPDSLPPKPPAPPTAWLALIGAYAAACDTVYVYEDRGTLALHVKPPGPARLDSTIHLDIRYATTNNFLGSVFYSSAHAFLQRPAAEALVRAARVLRPLGYGLLIHDAYRPWYITKVFWDATPPGSRWLVADPARGSKHNRGAAVDITLYDLATGKPVEMPSTYDEATPRAMADFPGGTSRQRWHRALLRRVLEAEGFTVNPSEWWHFDYRDWQRYPILNRTFEELLR